MKRKLIIFIAMMLPLMAMSQGVISRPNKKPAKTNATQKPPAKTAPERETPARNNDVQPSKQPAKQPARSTTGTINGHEWVDLGLSVKWATMNVGASSPSDYGDYFAWGEKTTKSSYTPDNCKTWEKSISDIAGNSQYDAARSNWGSPWRLPTRKECQDLLDRCTWTWTSQGGSNGYRVTSKTNGNSIFLPAAGSRYGTSLDTDGEYGNYWGSTPDESNAQYACSFYFNASYHSKGCSARNLGLSVRPVSDDMDSIYVDVVDSTLVDRAYVEDEEMVVIDSASVSTVPSNNLLPITVNGVTFNMIQVDGGTFTMGATSEMSDSWSNETPTHQVTLSSYYIGETEVTQKLWKAVMGNNPSYYKGDDLPVSRVSWNDCQTFIRKLNELTNRRFRLPTEAEWEFAARGGKKSNHTPFSGSSNIDDVAWYVGNSGTKPHPVMTKKPNELGIYDMSGNVCEWCQDWYGNYNRDAQTNPTGPASGSYRVNRGGGWYYKASICRSSCRSKTWPDSNIDHYLGFRLVLVD